MVELVELVDLGKPFELSETIKMVVLNESTL
jgi:hypothetical protein